MAEIDVFRALDYIRDSAPKFATAKAERVYLEEFRKSKKAILMQSSNESTMAMKEADAYAHPAYQELLDGLREAVAIEEEIRWRMEGAKLKIAVWQTMQADKRMEAKVL